MVAAVQEILPKEPALLYRALAIQSARWPRWTSSFPDKLNVLRSIGYGIPDREKATNNSPYRITLITSGEVNIRAGQVHIYEVIIPEGLRCPGVAYTILLEVTLSYKAEPRRTRRTKNRYLSTWLEWQSSKLNEPSDRNNNTVQNDWVLIKSHDFADTFSLAVIIHGQDIEIYSEIAVANEIEEESEQEVRIN